MKYLMFRLAKDYFRQAILWPFVNLKIFMKITYGDARHNQTSLQYIAEGVLDSDKKPAPDEITNKGGWQNNLKVNNWKFPIKDYFAVQVNEAVHRVK
jgi:hypothetical protein